MKKIFILAILLLFIFTKQGFADEQNQLKLIINQSFNGFTKPGLIGENKLISIKDGFIEIWDIKNKRITERLSILGKKKFDRLLPGMSSNVGSATSISCFDLLFSEKIKEKYLFSNSNNAEIYSDSCMNHLHILNLETKKLSGKNINLYSPIANNDDLIIGKDFTNVTKTWDINTGKRIKEIWNSKTFLNSGKIITELNNGTIEISDLNKNILLNKVNLNEKDIDYLYSTETKLIAGFTNGDIKAWDLKSGKILYIFKHHSKNLRRTIVIDKNRLFVNFSYPRPSIEIWDLNTGKLIREITVNDNGFLYESGKLAVSQGKVVASMVSGENWIDVWDIKSGKVLGIIAPVTPHISDLIVNKNQILVGKEDGVIDFYNLTDGNLTKSFQIHKGKIFSIKVQNNKIISSSEDGTIKISALDTGMTLKTINNQVDSNSTLDIINDKIVFSGTEEILKAWDIDKEKPDKVLKDYLLKVDKLTINNDKVITVSNKNLINIWDYKKQKIIKTIKIPNDGIYNISSDGKNIVCRLYSSKVKIFNLDSGSLVNTVDIGGYFKTPVPYKNKLIVPVDKKINIYDIYTGKSVNIIENSVLLALDKNKLFYLNKDNSLVIYDLDEAKISDSLENKINYNLINIINNNVIASKKLDYYQNLSFNSNNNFINIFDFKTGTSLFSDSQKNDKLFQILSWQDDENKLIAHLDNQDLKVVNRITGKLINSIKIIPELYLNSFGKIINDRAYSVTFNESLNLKVTDLNTGNLISDTNLDKITEGSYHKEYFYQDKLIISLSDGFKIWDINSGKLIYEYKYSSDQGSIIFYREKAAFFTTDSTKLNTLNVNIFDLNKLQITGSFKVKDTNRISFDYLDSDKIVFSNNYTSTKIYYFKTSKTLSIAEKNYFKLLEGNKIVFNSYKGFSVYDLITGNLLNRFKSDTSFIYDFVIHNQLLISGEEIIKVRDINSGKILSTLKGSEGYSILSVQDDRIITSTYSDSSLQIWSLKNGKLLARCYFFNDAFFLITPEGYYKGYGNYKDYVYFLKGNEIIDIDSFKDTYNNEEMIKQILSGNEIKNYPRLNYIY